jgi:chromosome segregation and condensation protein ScpB
LKEFAELEIEKQDLNQQIRDLKKDYEDQGVHTKEALKAWKEYQKQLKETSEEAQEVEHIKRLINQDDILSSTAVALSD